MEDGITITECVERLDVIRSEIVPKSRDYFALSAGIAALYEIEKNGDVVSIEKFKKDFVSFLKNNFSSVYCDTCESNERNDYEACECCHRKMMNWSISDYTAECAADKAVELFVGGAAKGGKEDVGTKI